MLILLAIIITWHPQPCDSFGVYAVHDSVTLIGTTADTCYQFDMDVCGAAERTCGFKILESQQSRLLNSEGASGMKADSAQIMILCGQQSREVKIIGSRVGENPARHLFEFDAGADARRRMGAGSPSLYPQVAGCGTPASPSRHYEVADHHGDIAGGRISPAVKGPEIPPIRRFFYVTAFLDTCESAPSEQVSALLLDWGQGAYTTCRVKRWRSAKRQHMLRATLPGQAESWCVYWTHGTDSITAVCEFEVTGDGWVGLSDLGVLREDLQHLSTFCRFADVYQMQGVISR